MKKFYLLILFAGLIPLAILILPMVGFKEIIEKIDWYSPFYIFTLQFTIGLLLFIKLSKDFKNWLKEIWHSIENPKSILGILIILGILTLTISSWVEGRSRVQADESIYIITAQNLYYNQIGTACGEGYFTENTFTCKLRNTVKPRGLSFLYMLGMPFFGTDLYWVYNFQTFLLFLTIPIFFLALLAWLKNKWLALLSTALLVMQPVLLFYSRSSSIEAFYIFMFTLSLFIAKWAYDRNAIRHWILLALTLAFFAQSRSEVVFCLFAFIGVVAYRCGIFPSIRGVPNGRGVFRIINSSFSIFLSTLSFFSIPVLCTLSVNRDSDLQGGSYGAHGHLLSNIIDDFKIIAFFNYGSDGLLSQPFLPYFTWIALFGLITLIILATKEKIYRNIVFFILLLSPQYIILFDGVSADLNLNTQSRFVLIILPAMSFLGALFIEQIITLLKNRVNPLILIIGILTIVCTATLVHYESFKSNIKFRENSMTIQDFLYKQFIAKTKKETNSDMIFFSFTPNLFLAHGISAYGYAISFNINKFTFEELFNRYNGNVFVSEDFNCSNNPSSFPSKMNAPSAFRLCDRLLRYFEVDTVLNIDISKRDSNSQYLTIYKILGLNDIDPNGLLRITQKIEPDSNDVNLYFTIPKDTIVPWKIEHFINDSLLSTSNYEFGNYIDILTFNQFSRDTNIWRLDIVDTTTNKVIHSDFWELVKIKF